jgi:hypothetical protein
MPVDPGRGRSAGWCRRLVVRAVEVFGDGDPVVSYPLGPDHGHVATLGGHHLRSQQTQKMQVTSTLGVDRDAVEQRPVRGANVIGAVEGERRVAPPTAL